jgi:small nuclear ribonucleoprotein D2
LISCRNNHKLLARVKAFDRHCNMVLENVKEVIPRCWIFELFERDNTNSVINRCGQKLLVVERVPRLSR